MRQAPFLPIVEGQRCGHELTMATIPVKLLRFRAAAESTDSGWPITIAAWSHLGVAHGATLMRS